MLKKAAEAEKQANAEKVVADGELKMIDLNGKFDFLLQERLWLLQPKDHANSFCGRDLILKSMEIIWSINSDST